MSKAEIFNTSRAGLNIVLYTIFLLFIIATLQLEVRAIDEFSTSSEFTSQEEILYEELYEEEASKDEAAVEEETTVYYCTAYFSLNVRSGPGTSYDVVGIFSRGDEIQVADASSEQGWARILYDGGTTAYVSTKYISSKEEDIPDEQVVVSSWDGPKLTKKAGKIQGPSGEETYYNLRMSGVVKIMRNNGFSEEEYPYWIREDGVKMLGPYVMCAANLEIHPRGSLVESSLGMAIVCDTGEFASKHPYRLDIAVNW